MTTSKISAIYLGQILFWLFEKDYVSAIYLEMSRFLCCQKSANFVSVGTRYRMYFFVIFVFGFFVVFKFCLYL